jgi:hypothetical protein
MHDFINELLFEDAIERTGVASSTTGQSRLALCKGRDTAPHGVAVTNQDEYRNPYRPQLLLGDRQLADRRSSPRLVNRRGRV